MKSHLVTEFLLPKRIVAKSDNVFDEGILLSQEETQVYIGQQKWCSIKGKGYLILDFGMEIQGGVRLLSHRFPVDFGGNIRIRFGESVNEACSDIGEKNATNNHSLRDFSVFMPHLADQSFGQTGFRFVRIDFLEEKEYRFVNIYASYSHRDMTAVGSFVSDDVRLNEIFKTAEHTLFLNCQENLLEGVKRDRLVWIGDMQPEVLAYSYLYKDPEIVETAVRDSIRLNPLPCWFGRIPTYSFWLITILRDYWRGFDKKELIVESWDYIQGVISQLDECVDEEGKIDYSKCEADAREGFFLDWPTNGTEDAPAGNRYVFIIALDSYFELAEELGLPVSEKAQSLKCRLSKFKEDPHVKQVVALGYLAGQIDKETARQRLFVGGSHGLCTFLSYFIFKAMAMVGTMEDTLSILKDYYGSMLDRGATSFFEDFNVDWLEGSGRIDELTKSGEKDIHGDYGAFCYKGFRHSLCHGWSVGPVSFLIEEVIGYKRKGNEVSVSLCLGNLKKVVAKIPTPKGDIEVSAIDNRGIIETDLKLPSGLKERK